MNVALSHRGPDDSGQFDGETSSIAMRRLSIIDLSGGHQPISNEDGTLSIVFNGEIYNFEELRKQLVAGGKHTFRTQSDTEVILHLFEDRQVETPKLLNGMFAFCIQNHRDQSLFLARDRFGEKPLYYSIRNGSFAFSSELDSLLQWPSIRRQLDYEALYYLLHLGYIPAPLTLFADVRQLPAGHWLRWEAGKARIESFYHPVYAPDPHLQDERVATEVLREILLNAVRAQMMADVPLGAFLSGGIDSSTVVAAMQRGSSRRVKTFTVRFEHLPSDEGPVARAVADHLGTDHHEFVLTNRSFGEEDLSRIVRHFGQPFLDSSAIPTFFISRDVRRHVSVALSGDGGDEIFGGYQFFPDALKIDGLSRLTRPVLAVAERTLRIGSCASFLEDVEPIRKAQRALEVARLPANQRPGAMEILFGSNELRNVATPFLRDRWKDASTSMTTNILDSVPTASRLRQLMHYRVKYSLAEDMLTKVDRMSMAASLEVRAPLLSADVTDLAMRLPDQHLINNGQKKHILREVGRPWLPDIVYSHPKSGFTIPLHMFQNRKYDRLCRRYLLESIHPVITQLFNHQTLKETVKRGIEGQFAKAAISQHRASHQLWGLLQLGAWAETYGVSL